MRPRKTGTSAQRTAASPEEMWSSAQVTSVLQIPRRTAPETRRCGTAARDGSGSPRSRPSARQRTDARAKRRPTTPHGVKERRATAMPRYVLPQTRETVR
jgi:hypothetical protein